MAYTPELEAGEILTRQLTFNISKKTKPFHFAVSNRAIYWPATKLIAMNDAAYFKCIQNSRVVSVSVHPLRPYGLWLFGAFMFLGGLALGILMYLPIINHEPGSHHISGWPFGLMAGGILMPFATKGRLGLEIKTTEKTLRWKPPLVVDKASRQKIKDVLDDILAACEKSGLKISRS